MSKKIHSSIFFILCALLFISPASWSADFFSQTFGDFQEELDNAKTSHKKAIFIFFEMNECPFCHRMKTTILNQPDVQQYFQQHFLNFTFDIEGDIEITDFKGNVIKQKDFAEKKLRIRATPVMAFFDLNGQLIFKHTGPTKDKQTFLQLGQYITKEIYKTTHYIKYKRAMRKR